MKYLLALLTALSCVVSTHGQTLVRMRPSGPAVTTRPGTVQSGENPAGPDAMPQSSGKADEKESIFSDAEIEALRTQYRDASKEEQAEFIAYFKDLGVDLEQELGLRDSAPAVAINIQDVIRNHDFARTPQAVLAARTSLGFAVEAMPAKEDGEALAQWLHTRVLAGEWGALKEVYAAISEPEAVAVYSHILRSTSDGGPGILPEEILVLGDACPGKMEEWQIDTLGKMLKVAAERFGKGPFLTKLNAGTERFGAKDDEHRQRTVRLLIGAGLATEAQAFLPPLETALAAKNDRVIYAHGRYFVDLASARTGAEADEPRQKGWSLLGDVALMDTADAELRKDAMKRAIDLLPLMPPAQAEQWLVEVFSNQALGPAALEAVALKAMSPRDKGGAAGDRAQGIATMKAAVDILLSQPGVNLESLRVPLRMLTTAMADEVETVVKEQADFKGVAPEAGLLFKASPSALWLDAVEPSVAIRGHRAAIAIAMASDETDVALDALAAAVHKFPDLGLEFAGSFLTLWEKRLNPRSRPGEEWMDNPYIFYAPQRAPSAPLTRGRQQRNLEQLARLLDLMDGMGVSARRLPSVAACFRACHARTEVFNREEIIRVFGPIEDMDAPAAASLAEAMRAGLGGDWRSRQAQRQYGMMRSQAEIGELVEVGYELAIELAGRAATVDPDSWRHAVLSAALNYDRVQYKQSQQQDDFARYNEYRRQSFLAFERAAMRYAELVQAGQERDNAGVYMQWFTAVLDAGQPTPDEKGAATAEESVNEDQISRIAHAMQALTPDAYERHVGEFARQIVGALGSVPPERKPTVVRAATTIVGDHPAGAPLRRLAELYEDLLKNEIRLRLTVDGPDAVPSKGLFGVVLTLRYTNSVDRETGGFDKYLYQDAFVRIGGAFRTINYQQQMQRAIETALSESFDVESIGFFEAMTPSRAVKEDGDPGWQEKPLAYLLIKAKDPSVDRIPAMSVDMHFEDQSGAVTLPILSNSPPIACVDDAPNRPIKKLEVTQTIDARRLLEGTEDRAVFIEISAKGEGVIPDFDSLVAGVEKALPGYAVAAGGVEARPYSVIQADNSSDRMYFFSPQADEKKEYPKADEDGIFRIPTERSWRITMTPTGAAVGSALTLPVLAAGLDGSMVSRHFADMDIVAIQGAVLSVDPHLSLLTVLVVSGLGVALIGAVVWILVRRTHAGEEVQQESLLPARLTPLSTIAALRRLALRDDALSETTRRELQAQIDDLQRSWFGPQEKSDQPSEMSEEAMRTVLERWLGATRG